MAESNPDRPVPPSSEGDKRLDSWKEIAAYLKRDVTTVRRWEKREGLPVHRHRHATIASVYAFTSEIDAWQHGREHGPSRDEPPTRPVPQIRLVGRETELRRLRALLERALEGQRQTVFIAGELGLGKTALTQAFLEDVRSAVWVAAGQCVEQYGKGEPYLPIIEALDRIIREDRSPETTRVVTECAPSWLDQLSLRSHLPASRRREHGVGSGTAHMAGELTDALEALAAIRPLVLLIEDLHWSDQATVEFIARLARRPEHARLLVIGTYRPAELYESGSPLLRVGRELRVHFQAEEIELTQLTRDAVGELIARERTWNDLGGAAASLRRWSGNPLFLIHFVAHLERVGHVTERDGRWYLDLEREAQIVPNSLRMLIEEQVDRLEPDHRQLLETASVVGETFAAALVARASRLEITLVERSFEDICRRSHLLTHREAAHLPDGTISAAYAFVHEFYRQVIHDRLPEATATELHRRIGTELEAAYGARAVEISGGLAMHFDRGQDLARAVRHYGAAAENAVARNADREAQLALSRAAELMVQLPDGEGDDQQTEAHLRGQLAAVLGRVERRLYGGSEAAGGETIGDDRCDAPALVDALIRLSRAHSLSGDLAAAKQIGDRAATVSRRRGRVQLEAIAQQAYVRLVSGEFTEGQELALRALAVADAEGVGESRERTRCSLIAAWTAWYLGRYEEARASISQMIASKAANLDDAVAPSLLPLLEWLGEADQGLDLGSSLGAGRRAIPQGSLWPAEAVQGWLLLRRGRAVEGVEILRRTAGELGARGLNSWLPSTLVWLTEGLQMNGQIDEALASAEEGLNLVRQTGARASDAELYRVRGEALIGRKRFGSAGARERARDAAEASCWAGIAVARQQDARTLELRATLSLSRLLHDSGRADEAARVLSPVCGQFATSAYTPELAEARRLLREFE